MKIIRNRRTFLLYVLTAVCIRATAQKDINLKENFNAANTPLNTIGRGECVVQKGTLQTKNVYATFGQQAWSDYEISFRACTPAGESQVQLWAGFRAHDRNNRYVLGLRGGEQNSLYLSRMGYMGTDELLAMKSLDFHPQPGRWYNFRIQVCGSRIRVFLNNEQFPRIDVTDKNSALAATGKIILGGGWITTLYDDLSVKALPAGSLDDIPKTEYAVVITKEDKESRRKKERGAYQPISITKINDTRTTISLDGQWLFMPLYELPAEEQAVSPAESDRNWHCMHVPDFWNPIRIWLHGETFGPFAKGTSDTYFQSETNRCEGYSFDYKKTSAAWYRQWIILPNNIEDKDLELQFDAVSKIAEVWINGKQAGKHTGMFGSFSVDGKGLFHPGKNLVTVKVVRDYVNDIREGSKVVDVAVSVEVTNKMLKDLAHGFYNGDPAGIWQPVKLVISQPLKITDAFIKPGLTGADIEVTVKNTGTADRSFSVGTHIADRSGKNLYRGQSLENSVVHPGEEKTFNYSIKDLKPLLWSPQTPNLYNFIFRLIADGKTADSTVVCSGFRTFESKNGYLWLNGRRYWLRGGNQTPFALAPNDRELADRFYDLMKAGNMEVTRTHTSPYNELWMDEADKEGIGISFEGTWPWLMLASSMPDKKLIDMWEEEFLGMIKKYRNHPSLLFWTINNEMKFYDNDPDLERAKTKMTIISNTVKKMRAVDSTRPVCFDSNYKRKGKAKKFGESFFSTIDDGDIDDIHSYINWYDYTIFRQFNGEFQRDNLTEGRPLVSQEMSTGYPNAETGHSTRFYTLVHQTPQSLVGDLAYEYSDPALFLRSQSFITGELAEALRRSNDKAAGILHFALVTWFKNVYDAHSIKPYATYYAMQRAMQPVLVSCELWGRHFYGSEQLPARICIVNDHTDGRSLAPSVLDWKLVDAKGKVLASGKQQVPAVPYYGREWLNPTINIPSIKGRIDAKLMLSLNENGKQVSANEYDIVLAGKDWNALTQKNKKIVLINGDQIKPVFDLLNIPCTQSSSIREGLEQKADVYVLAGADSASLTGQELQQIRTLVSQGHKLLVLDAGTAARIYPEYIQGSFKPTDGDIVNIDIPESPIFNNIDLLDLRYFNNNKRETPTVCNSVLRVNPQPNMELLAKHIRIHGYINGDMETRAKYMQNIQGSTIVKIKDGGSVTVSTMALEKGATDPIAGKLLVNMLNELEQ